MHAIGAVNSNGVIRPYGPLEAAARISRVDRVAAQVTAGPPVAAAPLPAATAAKKCKPYDPTVEWVPEGLADETALFAKNWADFPIAPGALVHRAKWVLAEPQFGLRDDSCLAPDFEFCAPFIGPLKKEEFLGALGNFKLQDAFDINENYHAFRADPFQPGRVWWVTRTTAAHTGAETPMLGAPTGKELTLPPQSFSLIFDTDGLVKELTVGYPIDRRVGNTGGLGGAFAFSYGVGKPLPIPECQPYKPSLQLRMLGWVSRVGKKIRGLFGKRGA